jgi:hypothetical protein
MILQLAEKVGVKGKAESLLSLPHRELANSDYLTQTPALNRNHCITHSHTAQKGTMPLSPPPIQQQASAAMMRPFRDFQNGGFHYPSDQLPSAHNSLPFTFNRGKRCNPSLSM